MNVFTQKRHTGKLAIAATSILSAVAAHAADVTAPKLVLTAYVNGVGGEAVMAGKFDAALTEIKRNRNVSSDAVHRETHQRMRRLHGDETAAASEELVRRGAPCSKARSPGRAALLVGSNIQNEYLAIAYANRAVVQMMQKNPDAAKADMAHAKSLAPDAEFVSKNLLAMNSPASKIAQVTAAPSR